MMNNTPDEPLVPGAHPDPASPHHATIKSTTQARAGVTFGIDGGPVTSGAGIGWHF